MSPTFSSEAATQISSQKFDQRFVALPVDIQERVQRKIDDLGQRLRTFPIIVWKVWTRTGFASVTTA